MYFYPRSPCGERPIKGKPASPVISISIHALLAESDDFKLEENIQRAKFLSTLSLRRATLGLPAGQPITPDFYPRSPCGERPVRDYTSPLTSLISIHALLAESDQLTRSARRLKQYFYPRSPCGERPGQTITKLTARYFYPRSPCGERPPPLREIMQPFRISIHALLAESDCRTDS